MRYSGRPPIHPMYLAQLTSQIADANADLKRGIDADWRASVLRYPEVLDYFYSLVELRTPDERSSRVLQPPFAAAGYVDRGYTDQTRLVVEKKKWKRRDREGSLPPDRRSALGRVMHGGPPPVPTPPLQHGYHQSGSYHY